MGDFRMPQLGADMAAATLTEWLKKPGDSVTHGDIIAVVETDKGTIEIEVFEDGVVDRLLVEPGAKVPVGTAMAIITGEQTEPVAPPIPIPAPEPVGPVETPSRPPPQAPVPVAPPAEPRTVDQRIRISPAAARLAAERGVDIRTLSGTGPGGAIRIADVETAGQAEGPRSPDVVAAEAAPATPADAMRRAIASAMGRSKREIPHYYLSTAIDMGRALDWLVAANENRPVTGRLIPGVLLIKAVARALESFPELNGFWRDDGFQPAEGIHIGWAISLRGGGLVAPALHDAGQMAVDPLMSALRDLVKRARAFHLRGSELSDPTITVTSLGEQGVETVYGVIYPPQVALVGFGRIVERPWVIGDSVEVRPILQASLAADHRTSDGHRGGLFLSTIDRLLQEPETL
jgi:pyruvate dehydrogenase E2 component (dihydrolipoamide acetyltransferase)